MIINPFANIPANENSHVRGWSQHWANLLNVPIAVKDELPKGTAYIDHGVNYEPGTLNLFGGLTDATIGRLDALAQSGIDLVSLDYSLADCGYIKNLEKRGLDKALLDKLASMFAKAPTLTQTKLDLEEYVIGDSHSTAFADKGQGVIRKNGMTCYGVITSKEFLLPTNPNAKKRILSLGSIDIRHHVLREGSIGTKRLVGMYVDWIMKGDDRDNIETLVCTPVPVEHEGRRIPKTGWYKGSPFAGSRESRLRETMLFIDELNRLMSGKVISPPRRWYEMDGEEYANNHMELSSSVHISPKHYLSRGGWDV